MKRFFIIFPVISVLFVCASCEKHGWDETRRLYLEEDKKKDTAE